MSDLISRQDAINACLNGVCACVSDCVDEIKQLPPVQQWISVTERLPDNAQNVLVCDNEGYDKCYDYVEVGYFEGEYWYDTFYNQIAVIAWMPLPEPYKGE